MKSNVKVTALEILEAAGVSEAGEVFGKTRVRIGGIAGIVSPDHLVKIQPGVEKIEIIVGVEATTLELEPAGDPEISEKAKEALEKRGRAAVKAATKLQEAKKKSK